ncbi:MAG TPA: hypothetical protein VHD90_14185 [Phototrophicaceae bacterium]|nr:hypothetical protein [Phototrophicaceae bacterium]
MAQEPTELQDLLDAVTEAIINEDAGLDKIVTRYDVSRSDVEGLVSLVHRLHVALVGVRPSRRFAQRLRLELMGQERRGVINRVRYLPPRVQIAGAIVLVGGFMLLRHRRHSVEADAQEVPALR